MIFATLQYLHSPCVAIKHEETQYLCVGFKLNSIFLFLIWFFLFCFWTPQFYKSSSFHIKYVENMWKCLVKYAFMCHHVSLKTFIKKTGKKLKPLLNYHIVLSSTINTIICFLNLWRQHSIVHDWHFPLLFPFRGSRWFGSEVIQNPGYSWNSWDSFYHLVQNLQRR